MPRHSQYQILTYIRHMVLHGKNGARIHKFNIRAQLIIFKNRWIMRQSVRRHKESQLEQLITTSQFSSDQSKVEKHFAPPPPHQAKGHQGITHIAYNISPHIGIREEGGQLANYVDHVRRCQEIHGKNVDGRGRTRVLCMTSKCVALFKCYHFKASQSFSVRT